MNDSRQILLKALKSLKSPYLLGLPKDDTPLIKKTSIRDSISHLKERVPKRKSLVDVLESIRTSHVNYSNTIDKIEFQIEEQKKEIEYMKQEKSFELMLQRSHLNLRILE